jgi:hypothetical protein
MIRSMTSPIPKKWERYEAAALEMLRRLAPQLGLSSIEGKQLVSGSSGVDWELDAKGIKDGAEGFVIIECRRYTTSAIKQEAMGAVAYRISDTGTDAAVIVSPIGLQEGAKKVARATNIKSIVLDSDATPLQFVASFLGDLFVAAPGLEARTEPGRLAPGTEVQL